MKLTTEIVAKRMLDMLPKDGTPVLNRVMRVMLARELEAPVEQDLYFAARDLLLKTHHVGRLRGQGGQIFFTPPEAPPPPVIRETAAESWSEAKLMEPLRGYLDGSFRQELDLPNGAVCLVLNTSAVGPYRGQWARPDYILVSAMRFKLMPGAQVDVHSFELKTESGCTVQSVHEALAQTRFTHFGHLVWHLPKGSKAETRLAEIEKHCSQHGVGLIRMKEPQNPESYDILVDPARARTLPTAVEGFLESRLSEAEKTQLSNVVHGAGA